MNQLSVTLLLGLALSQVPPQDECQLVNATEPPQCPETIGPPCPPCIVNDESDYTNGDSLKFTSSEIDSIWYRINQNLNYWYTQMPPEKVYPLDDPYSFVEGASGRSFLFMRMYYYTKNSSYLNYASEYMSTALRFTSQQSVTGYSSFMSSNVGVWILASVLYDLQGDNNNKNKYLNLVKSAFNDVINGINDNNSNSPLYNYDLTDGTFITGLSGLAWSGVFANNYYNSNIINSTILHTIALKIADLGIEEAEKKNRNYLLYEAPFTPGCFVPGASEGQSGVVKMLLELSVDYAKELLDPNGKYYPYIKNTLDFFLSIQLPDGNLPTYFDGSGTCELVYGNDSDARVQWCHGAPGFIDTLSRAAVLFSDLNETASNNYLESSLIVYNVTWQRGLLIKGLMHCHGIGGNAYQMLHIFVNFKDLSNSYKYGINNEYYMNQSIYRAQQFIRWTLNTQNVNALRTQYSDEDYSLWLGSYGIPMLYIQAIQNGWDSFSIPVCMVAWDFCFW